MDLAKACLTFQESGADFLILMFSNKMNDENPYGVILQMFHSKR